MATKQTEQTKQTRSPLQVGRKVLIRTVTHYHTGRVVELTNMGPVLEEAAWIADTGRFGAALATGSLNEIEPFPGPVLVNSGAIIDVTEWPHALPRSVK